MDKFDFTKLNNTAAELGKWLVIVEACNTIDRQDLAHPITVVRMIAEERIRRLLEDLLPSMFAYHEDLIGFSYGDNSIDDLHAALAEMNTIRRYQNR